MADWAEHDPPWIIDWIERVCNERDRGAKVLYLTRPEQMQLGLLLRGGIATMLDGMPVRSIEDELNRLEELVHEHEPSHGRRLRRWLKRKWEA